jgi:ribosome-binding protein aMBF1 (putative translation factor)
MNDNLKHQDWDQVIFIKPSSIKKVNKNIVQKPPSSIKLNSDDEVIKIKKITKNMSSAVIRARNFKNMTQTDLGVKSHVGLKAVKEIEKGGSLYNAVIFDKICRVLGTNIRRDC